MNRPLAFAAAAFIAAHVSFAQDVTPTPEPPPIVKVADADGIKALAGKPATVEGKITRIGTTSAGGITFINFAGSGSNGFVAVVFKSNYEAFGGGFDKYKGATVRVTGPVTMFKDATPQIVVKSPEQIKIIEEPAPAATPASTPN